MAKKISKKNPGVKKKKSQKPNKDDLNYADYLRIKHSIRYLTQVYQGAYQWKPKLSVVAPGMRPDEALKKIRARLQELRVQEKRYKKSGLLEQIHRVRCEKVKPFSSFDDAFRIARTGDYLPKGNPIPTEKAIISVYDFEKADIGVYETLESGRERYVPDEPEESFIIGKVKSSGGQECEWAKKELDGSEGQIEFRLPSYSPNFSNKASIDFKADLEAPSGCLLDPLEFMAKSAIFQFTLPPAPWDAAVGWDAYIFCRIGGLEISADYAWLSVEAWARQDPAGAWEFPACSSEYPLAFARHNVFFQGGEDVYIEAEMLEQSLFESAFPIEEGKQAKLYIGCSVGLWAENGSIEIPGEGTFRLCASNNSSDLGVGYEMYRRN